MSLLALVTVAGASAAAIHLLHKPSSIPSALNSTSPPAHTSASAIAIKPIGAQGFDALNPAGDSGDENTNMAANVLTGTPQGWATQEYKQSPYLGNLKAGTGLILDLGQQYKVSSITVTFGSVPGADVQIKVGNSNARSPANLNSMSTVASQNDVSGSTPFTVQHPVLGRYLVIWFTKLPPEAQKSNWYMAQVFGVAIQGTS